MIVTKDFGKYLEVFRGYNRYNIVLTAVAGTGTALISAGDHSD